MEYKTLDFKKLSSKIDLVRYIMHLVDVEMRSYGEIATAVGITRAYAHQIYHTNKKYFKDGSLIK